MPGISLPALEKQIASRKLAGLYVFLGEDVKLVERLVDAVEATVDEAIEMAATLLHEADMPLIYGMSNTTCEAQKECAAMADQLGGLLDSHTSL